MSQIRAEVCQAVDGLEASAVELVSELVAIRSENPRLLTDAEAAERGRAEEDRCQTAIADRLKALGMQLDRFEALPGREDVVGRLAGAEEGHSLILNGHVDVVPAGDLDVWPEDPWSGAVKEGLIWGRGSCDMKGGLAAGIIALQALQELGIRLAGDVVFQSVVDEESGGPGTHTALARGHSADAAIVLEPTAGAIMPVEGGLEWLRVTVRGVSGHSALRYRSVHAGGRGTAVNAIEKAAKLLAAVQELERHRGNTKVHPLLPKGITTINPGMISGGSPALSTMADSCVIGLSLKYLPDESAEDVKREFEEYIEAVAAADPWLRENPPKIEWGYAGVSFPPSEIALDHPFAQAVGKAFQTVLGEPQWQGFVAVSDLAWIAEAGIPGLLFGPGDPIHAHTSSERLEIADLTAATKIVALALCEWCGTV